ncbi:hypothetical protein BD770DRAFT_414394 [Pilaira anomala]|nr:hypothetical protein BD770DRAFT_414394 [Pilaira anomala]
MSLVIFQALSSLVNISTRQTCDRNFLFQIIIFQTWPADIWLENNYCNSNGLPSFFIQGKYGFENRGVGIQEYKETVVRATLNSHNTAFSSWAKDVVEKNFSVINNSDIKDYWIHVLNDENRRNQEGQYHHLIFENLNQHDFLSQQKNKGKRKQQETTDSTLTQRPRIEFQEVDDLIIPSTLTSVGSYIGTLARNQTIKDRKSRYFITCSMNNIIDMSDFSQGSQLNEFKDEITSLIPANDTRLTGPPRELEEFEGIIQNQVIREDKYAKYIDKCLEKIKAFKTKDKFEIVKDLYQSVFKLYKFHKYILKSDHQPFSEQDFVSKVWSPMIEIVFRSLDDVPSIIAHWGDTNPELIKENGKVIRTDLRFIACQSSKEIIDAGVAEFAPKVFPSKYYRDKLKMILASKAQLNSLVKDFSDLDKDSLRNLNIPFISIMGFECEIYTLRLIANGLYGVELIYSMTFPSTVVSLKEDGLRQTVEEIRGIKTVNDIAGPDWSRALWYPPNYDSDAD